jgi:hypothetical protein
MSSIIRRMRRKDERDKKKGTYVEEEKMYIPSIEEVEEYILNKSKELRNQKSVTPIIYEEVK